ncbi:hypothetical protein LCGC14_0458680 [marine sediment metagenome]|uniref:Uncharacterized protein n=1 Tax=marine sediment metagenome TaxID=412755 RepID=A0A0F9SFP4_9ZZZZ
MISKSHLKDYQEADDKTKTLIKALNNFVRPAYELGHISFTIDKCKKNNRTVFEFNDYFLINIDGMIFYCLQSDI